MTDNLDQVTKSSTTKSVKPLWGRLLAGRRAELGLSMTDIENATNGVVYAQLLYRLENGKTPPENLKAGQVQALLDVIGWDMTRWLEVTTQVADAPTTERSTVKLLTDDIHTDMRPIPVYDLLSAGPGGDGGTIVEYIDIPKHWKGEYAAYVVTGDSMSPYIPNKAKIVVRIQEYCDEGDIIACYAADHGNVVKVLRGVAEDGTVTLTSLNPNYPPIWAPYVHVFGVVTEIRMAPPVIDRNGNGRHRKAN